MRAIVILSFLLLFGCSYFREDLVRVGKLNLETETADGLSIIQPEVYEDGSDIVVRGYVTSTGRPYKDLSGKVTVLILNPKATIREEAITEFCPYRHGRRPRRYGPSRFEVRISGEVQRESIVRIIPQFTHLECRIH